MEDHDHIAWGPIKIEQGDQFAGSPPRAIDGEDIKRMHEGWVQQCIDGMPRGLDKADGIVLLNMRAQNLIGGWTTQGVIDMVSDRLSSDETREALRALWKAGYLRTTYPLGELMRWLVVESESHPGTLESL